MPLDKHSARIYYDGVKPGPQTPRPPKPQSHNSKPICEHKYVHYDCKKSQKYLVITGMTEWTRIDYFFLRKMPGRKGETET
jgi:hypothetical protein